MQTSKQKPTNTSPIDRMIRLIAEIEVARYFEEVNIEEPNPDNAEHESSHLRTLQR